MMCFVNKIKEAKKMRQIINNPKNIVQEVLNGYLKSHSEEIESTDNPRVFKLREEFISDSKVGVVSAGGSGHLPAFIGYVKPGILDVVAAGNIFEAPPAETILDAIRIADRGKGVICIYGNYELDNCCVKSARMMAEQEGISVKIVAANDDVATIGKDGDRTNARGLAGEVLLWKIAGAAAAEGMSLEQIEQLCQEANSKTRSIGVALSPCIIPEKHAPKFEVVEGTMEVGIGHHGDPGISTYKVREANKIAELMLKEILKTYDLSEKNEVIVLVSGLGSTIQMEMYILYNRIADILLGKNIHVKKVYIGNYFTSLNMHGVSVTLIKVNQQLEELITREDTVCF